MATLLSGRLKILKAVMGKFPLMIGQYYMLFFDHARTDYAKHVEGYLLCHRIRRMCYEMFENCDHGDLLDGLAAS